MTIARHLGRRIQFHVSFGKLFLREWNELRKKTGVVIATATTALTALLIYVFLWGHEDFQEAVSNLGDQ